MFRQLKKTFITGVLILLPLGLTAYILYAGFLFFDSILQQLIKLVLFYGLGIEFFRDKTIPGIGLITLVLMTLAAGVLTRNIFIGKILQWWYRKIEQMPFIGKIYKPLSQISEAIFSGKGDSFKKPVLIEFPRKGVWSIAFITRDGSPPLPISLDEEMVTVFMPTSPNPTSGFLMIMPKKDVYELNISAEDALKMILSGGAIIPENFPPKNEA